MTPLVVACGWISILGSLVLKVPQIVAVWRSRSARGVSLQSLLLELTGFSVSLAYNAASGYPLDSYAEYALLVAQDVLLLLLTLWLANRLTARRLAALAGAGAALAVLAAGAAPPWLTALLIWLAMPLGWSAKVVQLRAIVTSGDARAVSVATWLLAALTCATRIVTTLAETHDATMLAIFVVNLALNALVVAAALRYRHGPDVDAVKATVKAEKAE